MLFPFRLIFLNEQKSDNWGLNQSANFSWQMTDIMKYIAIMANFKQFSLHLQDLKECSICKGVLYETPPQQQWQMWGRRTSVKKILKLYNIKILVVFSNMNFPKLKFSSNYHYFKF